MEQNWWVYHQGTRVKEAFWWSSFSEKNMSSKLLEILLLQYLDGFGRQKVKHADSTLMHVCIAIVSRKVMSQRERKSQKHRQHNHSIPTGHWCNSELKKKLFPFSSLANFYFFFNADLLVFTSFKLLKVKAVSAPWSHGKNSNRGKRNLFSSCKNVLLNHL